VLFFENVEAQLTSETLDETTLARRQLQGFSVPGHVGGGRGAAWEYTAGDAKSVGRDGVGKEALAMSNWGSRVSCRISPWWVTTLATLLTLGGAAVCLVWYHRAVPASFPEYEEGLIRSLGESAAAVDTRRSPIRVALFDVEPPGGDATRELIRILESQPTCRWEHLSAADIQAGALEGFDVLLVPGGSGRVKGEALGDEGKKAVREFVRLGGGYVGICGGAFLAAANLDYSLILLNANALTGQIEVPGGKTWPMTVRGRGTVQMELTDAGRSLLGGPPGLANVYYTGGPILSPAGRHDLPDCICVAWFRTEIYEHEVQRGTMVDTAAIAAARYGKGRVIAFSPHPEMSEGLDEMVVRAVLSTARIPPDLR